MRRAEPRQAEEWVGGRRRCVVELEAELEQLPQCHAQPVEDNRTNPNPIPAVFRLDVEFGNGRNNALLFGICYEVYTKPTIHQGMAALSRRVALETTRTQVGCNGEMVIWEQEIIGNWPHALDAALERFHIGDRLDHNVLLHYGEDEVTAETLGSFACSNGRQAIEAGIKKGEQVFQMHYLKVRFPAMQPVQEWLAAFAANLVREAALRLCQTCPQRNVKQMVRMGASTFASVTWQPQGCLVRFTELSPFEGYRHGLDRLGLDRGHQTR